MVDLPLQKIKLNFSDQKVSLNVLERKHYHMAMLTVIHNILVVCVGTESITVVIFNRARTLYSNDDTVDGKDTSLKLVHCKRSHMIEFPLQQIQADFLMFLKKSLISLQRNVYRTVKDLERVFRSLEILESVATTRPLLNRIFVP